MGKSRERFVTQAVLGAVSCSHPVLDLLERNKARARCCVCDSPAHPAHEQGHSW